MVKSLLHLEDIHRDPGLQELLDGQKIVSCHLFNLVGQVLIYALWQ